MLPDRHASGKQSESSEQSGKEARAPVHARDEEAECLDWSYEAEGVDADVCSLVAVRNEEQEGDGAEADAEYESDGDSDELDEEKEEVEHAAANISLVGSSMLPERHVSGKQSKSSEQSGKDSRAPVHASDEEAECMREQVGRVEVEGEEGVEADGCSLMAGDGAETDAECESDRDSDESLDIAEEEVEHAAPNISPVESLMLPEKNAEVSVESLVESGSERDGEGHKQGVSTRKEKSAKAHTKGGRKPGKRRYVWCPIDGCLSGPVQKLTQHLYQVHKLPPNKVAKLNTPENRRYAPPEAVKNRTPCPPRRQRTLEALLQRHPRPAISITASSSSTLSSKGAPARSPRPTSKGKERKGTEVRTKGKAPHTPAPAPTSTSGNVSTRRMGFHKSDPFLEDFGSYLKSRTGGKRSDEATRQLCKNVSKYLFFLDSESVRPQLLLKKKPLVEYLKVVEEGYGVGCSGLLQKLDAVTAALKFMKFSFIDEDEEEESEAKIDRMLEFISHQRKSYKVGKVRSERVRLEELAANPPDLSGIVDFITDPSLTAQFISTVDQILGNPSQATRTQYRFCLAILAGRILYRWVCIMNYLASIVHGSV